MHSLIRLAVPWAAAIAVAIVALALLPSPVNLALAAVILIAGSAWTGTSVWRRHVLPMQQLSAALGARHEDTPASELAQTLTTEYRRAMDQLTGSLTEDKRRQAALTHTSDAVIVIDPDGLVEYANPTARMFLQDRVLDVTRKLQQPDLDRLVNQARQTGQAIAEDVTLWIPGRKPARARAVPLADGASVLLLSDLSESYRLDRMRRDFVANVSHELKTPVAGIRALAETAATALSSDDLQTAVRFVERLGTEAARLSGLVSDLLDLSRVEVGGELELGEVDIGALLVEATDRARAVAEVKGIEFDVCPSRLKVTADQSQLSMAVKNLVDNAVRYSERGRVRVSADNGHGWIAITVADEGIGIPTDEIQRIFERFYRVDKARSRATGGTGLGLAIVRHIAENHGGRVEVDSELGIGSTFRLILPADESGNGDPATP